MEVVGLKLRCLEKIRTGGAVGSDDFSGKKIIHALAFGRFVGGKNVIEGTILTHDNDYVLDGLAVFGFSWACKLRRCGSTVRTRIPLLLRSCTLLLAEPWNEKSTAGVHIALCALCGYCVRVNCQ